jgi:hypothetical protein
MQKPCSEPLSFTQNTALVLAIQDVDQKSNKEYDNNNHQRIPDETKMLINVLCTCTTAFNAEK